jgi:hypothetical protein
VYDLFSQTTRFVANGWWKLPDSVPKSPIAITPTPMRLLRVRQVEVLLARRANYGIPGGS